jgi:hypothetical protein
VKEKLAKILIPMAALICLAPFVGSATALLTGVVLAVFLGNPYPEHTRKLTHKLLTWSVVGLGAASTASVPNLSISETKPALSPVKPPVAMDEKVVNPPALPMGTAGVGYLYRGTISITNIEAVEPKITEKIEALGGRKAGSVELGWKKTENSLYYHFTIPEARYTELLTFLSTYGTPKFSKKKHSRVMPDGIIRLIFNVDEKSK